MGPPILSGKTGMFVDSCLIHCQTITDEPWMKYVVNGMLMRDAFAAWYFDDEEALKAVDPTVWPDNPSCPNTMAYQSQGMDVNPF